MYKPKNTPSKIATMHSGNLSSIGTLLYKNKTNKDKKTTHRTTNNISVKFSSSSINASLDADSQNRLGSKSGLGHKHSPLPSIPSSQIPNAPQMWSSAGFLAQGLHFGPKNPFAQSSQVSPTYLLLQKQTYNKFWVSRVPFGVKWVTKAWHCPWPEQLFLHKAGST